MRSAPQSRLLAAISLIKLIVSGEILGFLVCAFDVRFQNKRKSSRCQREIRLRLDDKEGLFPGPDHPGESHQEKPIPFPVDRSFDLGRRMTSWCRNRAFSASSSDFPLVISARMLWQGGLFHWVQQVDFPNGCPK